MRAPLLAGALFFAQTLQLIFQSIAHSCQLLQPACAFGGQGLDFSGAGVGKNRCREAVLGVAFLFEQRAAALVTACVVAVNIGVGLKNPAIFKIGFPIPFLERQLSSLGRRWCGCTRSVTRRCSRSGLCQPAGGPHLDRTANTKAWRILKRCAAIIAHALVDGPRPINDNTQNACKSNHLQPHKPPIANSHRLVKVGTCAAGSPHSHWRTTWPLDQIRMAGYECWAAKPAAAPQSAIRH